MKKKSLSKPFTLSVAMQYFTLFVILKKPSTYSPHNAVSQTSAIAKVAIQVTHWPRLAIPRSLPV